MSMKGRIKTSLRILMFGSPTYTNNKEYRVVSKDGLNNRVAVVTGGYGSIGFAICQRLALDGAVVYCAGRNEGKASKLIGSMPNIRFLELDVLDEMSIKSAFDRVKREEGRIDILVNCAGGSTRQKNSPLRSQSIEVIDSILDTNLRGSLLCSREACKAMAEAKAGCVINISSIVGDRGKSRFTEYCASKAGVSGYTKSLALEMGRFGVRVNCVSPGFIQRGDFNHDQLRYNIESNCLGRVGCAEDVASAVSFLASDEASFITGQNLYVDGGRSLGLMGDCR